MLTPWRGGPCPITIEYTGREAHGALTLGGEWSVRASRELLEQLEGVPGRGALQVIYGPPAASPRPPFAADARRVRLPCNPARLHPRLRTTDRRARSE